MSEQIFNTRIVHKHDIEANWNKATNFIPKQGELIVYDVDDTYSYVRTKIGDGVKTVAELPFIVKQADWEQSDEIAPDFVKNRTHYAEWEEGVIFDNVTLTYVEDETMWYYEGEGALPILAVGKEYKININGQQYTSILQVSYEEDGLPTYGLGNLGALDASYEDSGESFVVLFTDYDPGDGNILTALIAIDLEGTFGNSLVVTIEGKITNNIKKLDEIYMPDSYAEVKSGLFDLANTSSSQISSLTTEINWTVKYTAQSLTDAQKTQARTNIGAASLSDIPEIPEFTQVQADLSEVDETSAAYVKGQLRRSSISSIIPHTGTHYTIKGEIITKNLEFYGADDTKCVFTVPLTTEEQEKIEEMENSYYGLGCKLGDQFITEGFFPLTSCSVMGDSYYHGEIASSGIYMQLFVAGTNWTLIIYSNINSIDITTITFAALNFYGQTNSYVMTHPCIIPSSIARTSDISNAIETSITPDDIDTICGQTISYASEVSL